MKNWKRITQTVVLLVMASAAFLQAWGSMTLTISPTTAVLQTGMSQQFTATVKGTTKTNSSQVAWFVNGVRGGSTTYGTISSTGLYNAPSVLPSNTAVTVTVKNTKYTSYTANASVTLVAGGSGGTVTTTITPTSATVAGGQSQQFAAAVTGTTNTAVNWYVAGIQGGNSTVGTISNGLYTAPRCPSSSTATVTAQSAYDSTARANATVTLASASGGSNYYVSTTGSDSNSGTACQPWRTIQHAASSVSAGATVHVAPGTYNESPNSSRSGTSTAHIRFVSDVKWNAKVVSSGTGTSWAWLNSGSYVDIEGFDITGLGAYGVKNIGSYDRLIGNHVHNIPASNCASGGGLVEGGYSLVPLPSHNTYIGNVIHDIGGAPGTCNQTHGIYIGLPYAVAYNNIVYNSTGRGIQLYHAATNVIVTSNTLFNNGWGIVINADSAAGYKDNNSFVANNIVYKNVNYGVYSGAGYGTGNQCSNNLVYGNGSNWGSVSHTNDVTADPQFVNPTGSYFTGDYHTKSTSPAIDKGTTTATPSIDFDFGPRPMGAAPDIGAFEYSAQPSGWSVL